MQADSLPSPIRRGFQWAKVEPTEELVDEVNRRLVEAHHKHGGIGQTYALVVTRNLALDSVRRAAAEARQRIAEEAARAEAEAKAEELRLRLEELSERVKELKKSRLTLVQRRGLDSAVSSLLAGDPRTGRRQCNLDYQDRRRGIILLLEGWTYSRRIIAQPLQEDSALRLWICARPYTRSK